MSFRKGNAIGSREQMSSAAAATSASPACCVPPTAQSDRSSAADIGTEVVLIFAEAGPVARTIEGNPPRDKWSGLRAGGEEAFFSH